VTEKARGAWDGREKDRERKGTDNIEKGMK